MKDQGSSIKRNRFEEECYCGEFCTCGIASDLYNEHAKEYYAVSDEKILVKFVKKNDVDFDDFEDEDFDFDFDFEDFDFEDEEFVDEEPVDEVSVGKETIGEDQPYSINIVLGAENINDTDATKYSNELKSTVQNEAAEIKPFKTPNEIEKRKSDLIGTKYFNNEFAIANCHLVVVEVIFKNTPKKDIPGYVAYAADENFEILELKDDYVKFIAHYDPTHYDMDIIMNHVHYAMGYENYYSIVYFDFL